MEGPNDRDLSSDKHQRKYECCSQRDDPSVCPEGQSAMIPDHIYTESGYWRYCKGCITIESKRFCVVVRCGIQMVSE
jgi:hypothetical protein